MDRQRYAIIVMSLVLAIGGTALMGLIAFGPKDAQTLPDDVPNPRPRPAPKKKAESKPQADVKTPVNELDHVG